jgi:hypothetical protein
VNGMETYLVKEVKEIGLRRWTLLRLPWMSENVGKCVQVNVLVNCSGHSQTTSDG